MEPSHSATWEMVAECGFIRCLITGDLDPALKQDLFERWVAGLSFELEDYNRELTRLMEIRYGSNH
jgi:hypothetical protein